MPDPESIRAEITSLKAKRLRADDPDVQEAIRRLIDSLEASIAVPDVPDPESEQDEVFPPVDERTAQQIEGLLRRFRVEKMRGNAGVARKLIDEAVSLAPAYPPILEVQADELMDSHRPGEARVIYAKALKIDPKNAGIEKKYAETVLRTSVSLSPEEMLRRGLSDSTLLTGEESLASAKAATVLSLFVPGAGQFVMGQNVVGGVILGGWLVCAFWLFLMRSDLQALLGEAGIHAKGAHIGSANMIIIIPLLVSSCLHLASIAMAASAVKAQPKRIISRPLPPDNLPFE